MLKICIEDERNLEYFQHSCEFVVLAKTYLDNQNFEFTQMVAIISAIREYYVGGCDKIVAIHSITVVRKKSGEIVLEAAQQK